MEMKRCPKGHFYDPSEYAECPHPDCHGGRLGAAAGPSGDIGYTVPVAREGVPSPKSTGADHGDYTQVLIKEKLGIDPVVGWLVCVEGADKGRDYRIHSDNNYIGRGERMDIAIRGDKTISRENHAIISFDSASNTFYFAPQAGRSMVRLNGKALLGSAELDAHDELQIGGTTLLFIPLCGERFQWA